MASLTKDSSLGALVQLAPRDPPLYNALNSKKNQASLAAAGLHSVGELLTPEGENALLRLEGMGQRLMIRLHTSLLDNGFYPDWPSTGKKRIESGSELTHSFSLERAIVEADCQHAIKTGGTPGEFSRKVTENTKAQEDGARLKGRRTL